MNSPARQGDAYDGNRGGVVDLVSPKGQMICQNASFSTTNPPTPLPRRRRRAATTRLFLPLSLTRRRRFHRRCRGVGGGFSGCCGGLWRFCDWRRNKISAKGYGRVGSAERLFIKRRGYSPRETLTRTSGTVAW